AWEIHGSVFGRGWGGTGILARAANAHYDYEIQFVARWLVRGGGKTMLTFHPRGSPPLIAVATPDFPIPPNNVNRFAERLADTTNGRPTLLNHGAYISMNARGMLSNGRFAAKFDTNEVPVLSDTEAASLLKAIGNNYTSPDLVGRAAVPTTV